MKLSRQDFKMKFSGYGCWICTYTYPSGKQISKLVHADDYDMWNSESPKQIDLKQLKNKLK